MENVKAKFEIRIKKDLKKNGDVLTSKDFEKTITAAINKFNEQVEIGEKPQIVFEAICDWIMRLGYKELKWMKVAPIRDLVMTRAKGLS